MLREIAIVVVDITIGGALVLLYEAYRRQKKLEYVRLGNLLIFVALTVLFRV